MAQSIVMLAPQFTLRRLLLWVTISAVVCLVLAAAWRGYAWSAGLVVALAGVPILLAVHGAVFGIMKLAALFWERLRRSGKTRPSS